MSIFACAVRMDGGRVPESFRDRIVGAPQMRGHRLAWHEARGFAGAIEVDATRDTASIARLGQAIAIGVARIDNRRDVSRWIAAHPHEVASDLALALAATLHGEGAQVGRLLGDFAFVVWDPTRRLLLAARDTFGVRTLFHADAGGGVLGFASHASLLASGDEYDTEYLLARACQGGSAPERTVFAAVRAVPPASVIRARQTTRLTTTTYWSAARAQATSVAPASASEQCDAFRSLLIDGVRARLDDAESAWSQLSGGLDSSSVVSVAQWLAARGALPAGLAGTVSYIDTLGTSADEREYSASVAAHHGLRNELVPHRPSGAELLDDPPLLDQPDMLYGVAIRDRAAARIVTDAGGRVLLTGEGGDALVAGTMFFFADWLVTGRACDALREMAHRSALGRVSFWRLAYENAVLPLLAAPLRRALTRTRHGSIPPWIPRAVSRRFALASAGSYDRIYRGRLGRKYSDGAVEIIGSIGSTLPLGPWDEALDVRHPYLHRPLVELALRLAPELCVQPHARKWILREAMRGILPEKVRTRVGKGALDGLHLWSLTHDRQRMERLLRDPILAQLGCIEPAPFQKVLDDVQSGRRAHEGWRDRINSTLEVEMWLQLRSGRWAAAQSQSTKQVVRARHAGHTLIGQ